MTQSFLLRFQEPFTETSSDAVATGTETRTKINQEQSDADPTRSTFRLLPVIANNVGTATKTGIAREQGDADYSSSTRILPSQTVMGTRSTTAVRMEGDDQDPCKQEMRVLPRCSSY